MNRAKSRRRRILVRVAILVGVLAVAAAAVILFLRPEGIFPRPQDPEGVQPLERDVTVTRGDLVRMVSAVGNLAAAESDELAFEINGTLSELLVAPGDAVSEGQMLARLDAADLEQALVEAEESLESANLDHASLLEPPDADDVLLAQLALTEAESALARLRDFEDQQQEVTLRRSLLTSQRSLQQALSSLTDLEGGAAADQIAGATAAFQRAEATWLSERESYQDFLDGPSELELETARLTLKQAEDKLEDYRDSSRTTQTDIDLQELVVIEARERLAELEAPVSEAEKRRRAISLAAAEQEYENARLRLLDLTESDSGEIALARLDYQAALLSVTAAQLALTDYQAGPDDHQIADAENTIVRRGVELRRLQEPPDPSAVRKSELLLAAAQRRVDDAREQLAKAELHAPYQGVITSASGTIGAQPMSGFIRIQSSGRPLIETRVTEIDIGKIAVGQAVTIEPDIFGSEDVYQGTVKTVNPRASSDAGLVTYDLTIEFDSDPANLLPGMTVALDIVIETRPDVILVPLTALNEEEGRTVVQVVDPETGLAGEREVEIGGRNEIEAEVVSGLAEGEVVRTSFAMADEIELSFGPPEDDQ